MTPFQTALAFTLNPSVEGGQSNNPADLGKLTMAGVTQATWDSYCRLAGLPQCPVTESTPQQREALYYRMFWEPSHAGSMPLKLAVAHFDWSVNHGVSGAIKTLQRCLGVTADGSFGPHTLDALQRADKARLLEAQLETREAWYARQVVIDPTQVEFIDGWDNRIALLRKYLEALP